MVQESVNCANCGAQGWTEAAATTEQTQKEIECGNCGYVNQYTKKPYKAPIMK